MLKTYGQRDKNDGSHWAGRYKKIGGLGRTREDSQNKKKLRLLKEKPRLGSSRGRRVVSSPAPQAMEQGGNLRWFGQTGEGGRLGKREKESGRPGEFGDWSAEMH